jgi:transcriptional regulator with XRE-family HTH domain
MKSYTKAERRIEISPEEPVRILRELEELSQNELSELTSIPQSRISAIERDRINLGVERAKVLARALRCHPAVLFFLAGMSQWKQLHKVQLKSWI